MLLLDVEGMENAVIPWQVALFGIVETAVILGLFFGVAALLNRRNRIRRAQDKTHNRL